MTRWIWLASFLVVAAWAGPAYAQISPQPEASLPTSSLAELEQPKLLEALDLSASQLITLRRIRDRHREPLSNNRRDLSAAQQDLRELLAGEAPDPEIRPQFEAVQTLRQDRAQLYFEQMLELRAVLSPAQRQALAEFMGDRRANRSEEISRRWSNWRENHSQLNN